MSWSSGAKFNGFGLGFGSGKLGEDMVFGGNGMRMGMMNNGGGNNNGNGNAINGVSHGSTVERLYAWEKKLFHEVKVLCSNLSLFLYLNPAPITVHCSSVIKLM